MLDITLAFLGLFLNVLFLQKIEKNQFFFKDELIPVIQNTGNYF